MLGILVLFLLLILLLYLTPARGAEMRPAGVDYDTSLHHQPHDETKIGRGVIPVRRPRITTRRLMIAVAIAAMLVSPPLADGPERSGGNP